MSLRGTVWLAMIVCPRLVSAQVIPDDPDAVLSTVPPPNAPPAASWQAPEVTATPPLAQPRAPWQRPSPLHPRPAPATAQALSVPEEDPPGEHLLRVSLGMNFRQIFLASILAADEEITFGSNVRGLVALTEGQTFSGRGFYAARTGIEISVGYRRFHFGGGLDSEYLAISRITPSAVISTIIPEVFLTILCDVARWTGGAFFVGVRGSAEHNQGGNYVGVATAAVQVLGTGTLLVGVGYR